MTQAASTSLAGVTHGESRKGQWTPEYRAFHHAQERCNNPNIEQYPNYGGRGIEFRLTSVLDIVNSIGRRPSRKHSLDRKDVNGHYEISNLRWATWTEQQRNRRNNRILTINGVGRCAAEWAEISKTPYTRIRIRLGDGWCDECAVYQPFRKGCPHKEVAR